MYFFVNSFLFSHTVPERRTLIRIMITINGKNVKLPEGTCVSEYLAENQYQPNRIAIELNGKILPKSLYTSTALKDGDTMEIVSFVGGG